MGELTPQKAIRKYCIECIGGTPGEVKHCGGNRLFGDAGDGNNQCWFYPYRFGRGKGKPTLKLIRKHCLECMGNSYQLVSECPTSKCPVFIYRFGKRMNRR